MKKRTKRNEFEFQRFVKMIINGVEPTEVKDLRVWIRLILWQAPRVMTPIEHSLARSLYLLRHWEETSHNSETCKVKKEVWAWPAHTSSCKKYKSVGPKLKNQVVWENQLVRSELCSWSVHPHCPHKATGMYLSTLWSSSSYVHVEL